MKGKGAKAGAQACHRRKDVLTQHAVGGGRPSGPYFSTKWLIYSTNVIEYSLNMPGTVLDFVGTLMDKASTSLSLECLQHACAYRTTAVHESKAVSWPGGPLHGAGARILAAL